MGARIPGWASCKACPCPVQILSPETRDRVRDSLDGDDLEPVDFLLRLIGPGDDRLGEAELGGLLQPLLAARRRAHLAREADFAEHRELLRQRLVSSHVDKPLPEKLAVFGEV